MEAVYILILTKLLFLRILTLQYYAQINGLTYCPDFGYYVNHDYRFIDQRISLQVSHHEHETNAATELSSRK